MRCAPPPVLLLLLLLVSARTGRALTVLMEQAPDDEYEVEHQVTYQQAVEQARQLKLYPGPIPGCKACTSLEMQYCRDGSVLEDHCCCDNSYNEALGFVEHTCRVGSEACQVRAGNCAEYTRLRECCCHSHLASLWKYIAGGTEAIRPSHGLLVLSCLIILLMKSHT